MSESAWADRKSKNTITDGASGFSICFAGMKFDESDLKKMAPKFERAKKGMAAIEAGEIKNPDENRKVTHFTDRASYTGSDVSNEIEDFVRKIVKGEIKGSTGKKFDAAVINGIGGSALGPQLMQFAVNGPYWNELSETQRKGFLKIYFLDNTDSSGVADFAMAADLERTLTVHISKSGGTQETKNNTAALEALYKKASLEFGKHACAITMKDSSLHRYAGENGWLQIFDMAESIGGRTSETSVVGHLPAALTGVDFAKFISGARHMDELTRNPEPRKNPAFMLAAMWYIAGGGKGDRNMVIVPYSDRLVLLSKYLQQLVMESVGKEKDLDGKTVHQGLNVFGNKGGTDAHAYIQQLNDGRDDFFVTFIEILKDPLCIPIAKGLTMGDYLHGFMTGLSSALRGKGRQVIEITLPEVSPFTLGMIIALYERAVAVYAEFININAFHQPGVQAYKLASGNIINIQLELMDKLVKCGGLKGTCSALAEKLKMENAATEVAGLLAKFAGNAGSREFNGFSLTRDWDTGKGEWIYTVRKK